MAFRDLRGWMAEVEALGQLQIARGAHWDLEIGTITELVRRQKNRPAVVFDDIPGYSSGFRVLGNIFGSVDRMALTWGLPLGLSMKELKDAVSKKYRSLEPIPPIEVSNGPIMENVMSGAEVDLFKFPVPKWHELDGGRYIGTASATITRDPEENWVNLGTYRVMVMDKNHVGFMISTGHQGRTHRDKYFARNQPMPVAISCGHDPTIFLVASREYPWGVCEYDYAGAIKGQPIEVIKGPLTGLPIPATAEIVLEGFATPGETRIEGPFGEYTGYYGSAARDEPIIEIKAVYYRNDPIILGSPPSRPPSEQTFTSAIVRSVQIEEELIKAGIPDVKGVWCHEASASHFLTVVAIKQRYPGHARQAGMIATFCQSGGSTGRFIVVVDDDVDITNLEEVIWVMGSRCDPVKDIEIVRDCWSSTLDPIIPKEEKGLSSRAIIDACRPFKWMDSFPAIVGASPELEKKTVAKWGKLIYG